MIDMSTVYPETSQELSRLGAERGVDVLDVTISGSTPVAENGLLTLFGGGNEGALTLPSRSFALLPRGISTSDPTVPERR